MSNPKPLQFAAVLQIAVFLAVLVLPLANTNFHAKRQRSQTENRNLNAFPKFKWKAASLNTYPIKFEAAFNDHFGFRSLLTRWHALLKMRVFGVSPLERVILGKDDWLYLTESAQEYQGTRYLKEDKAGQWARELKAKRAWLEARGIRYLLVVAPNKEEIYPEYLPSHIRRAREIRNLDVLFGALDDDFKKCVVDLRGSLLEGRKYGLVFDRTDTHWSHLGAFLAVNEILARLHAWYPQLQPAPLDQRPRTPVWGYGGDLATMLGLNGELREERLTVSPAPAPFAAGALRWTQPWPEGSLQEPPYIFENPARDLTLLITGDSFGAGVLESLPGHFRRVVRLRPEIPYSAWFQEALPALVEAEKPDIYLDIFCSRSLRSAPKAPFPGK